MWIAPTRLGWALVCRVPESWARWAFRFVGDIAWQPQGRGCSGWRPTCAGSSARRRPARNCGPCPGPRMRSYARYWMEVFRLPVITREQILVSTTSVGARNRPPSPRLAADRGVVFALPHMGNWEVARRLDHRPRGGKFTTVAERLKPESVYLRFLAFRESLGFEVLPATGGNSRFGVLAQRLRGRRDGLPARRPRRHRRRDRGRSSSGRRRG